MHDGQGLRFEAGQRAQDALGVTRIREVAGQRSLLHLLHRLARGLDQIGGGQRFDVAEVMKEVGTEQRLARLLEQHTGIPAVRDVR